MLPTPVWDGRDDVIFCYNYAWRTAFGNLRRVNGESNFVSNFIDTAFNGFLFMWDSSFIVMFGKYGSRAFNFQKTLDNFYSHQHKDGFICRGLCESEAGEHFSRHDPSSTGPNILGWSEWEYYCQTTDTDRLKKVFDPLLAYHLWLKEHRTWRDGGYWRGGVWAPTNYMVLKGLEKNGYEDLAYDIGRNCLENVIAVFEKDKTLYENYAPESASCGNPAKGDFVGWSGLFPINILFEYVFGIRPFARENKIIWNVRLTNKHGIINYPFNDLTVDLICEKRVSADDAVFCDNPIEIEIRYGNKSKTVRASVKK